MLRRIPRFYNAMQLKRQLIERDMQYVQ